MSYNDLNEMKDGYIIETIGIYNRFPFTIVAREFGHRCGYIGIDKNKYPDLKILEQCDYDKYFDFHGCVTFKSENSEFYLNYIFTDYRDDIKNLHDYVWIGFDCYHSGDAKDPGILLKFDINRTLLMEESSFIFKGIVWTNEMVRENIYSAIDGFLENYIPDPPQKTDYEYGIHTCDYQNIRYIDFDGVINSYKSGWNNEDEHVILDEPIEGVKEAFEYLISKGIKIVIFTCRGNTEEGRKSVESYLKKYEIPYTAIYHEKKPCGRVYVDDRGFTFKGKWTQDVCDEIIGFKSHIEKKNKPDKIVRDLIPTHILSKGEYPIVEKVNSNKAVEYLIKKLHEEVDELYESKIRNRECDVYEIADILEIVFAILKKTGISTKQVSEALEIKAKLNGKFEHNIVWKGNQNETN